MRLTNTTGLPAPLVAVAEKLYGSHPKMGEDVFSATEILKSVRQIVMGRLHGDEIEQDVQDTFSAWFGTSIHDLLEKEGKNLEGYMTETRLEAKLGDFTISGEFDLLDTENNVLYDYKTCKVATIDQNRTLKEDKWIRQLYLYRWILEQNGYKPPKKGVIVAMATDYSKIKASNTPGYPEHPIQILEWDLDDMDFLNSVLENAEAKAIEARRLINEGGDLPKCSYSDCWCTEDYAVKKDGTARAIKKFDTEDEARVCYSESYKDRPGFRLFHRVSEFRNCRYYCPYSGICEQWQSMNGEDKLEEDITNEEYIPF